MGEKYGQYVIKAPMGRPQQHPELLESIRLIGEKPWDDWRNINMSAVYTCIVDPMEMLAEPHKHDDFEQYLWFIGGNPEDMTNLGAEIELYLGEGEETENFTITEATIVRIPKGVAHGPFYIRRVDKPFVFLDIFLAPEYIKK